MTTNERALLLRMADFLTMSDVDGDDYDPVTLKVRSDVDAIYALRDKVEAETRAKALGRRLFLVAGLAMLFVACALSVLEHPHLATMVGTLAAAALCLGAIS